jgi:DNA-binding transcriptional regulator YhcF (GntR family)
MTEKEELDERIAARIRQGVTTGRFLPGIAPLDPRKLAERLQVSRHTVDLPLGLLDNEGLIKYNGSQVTLPQSAEEKTQLPSIALPKQIKQAFSVPRVYLDVFSLTGETFFATILPYLRVLQNQDLPLSISIRLLIADLTQPLTYPSNDEDRLRLQKMVRTQLALLWHELKKIREHGRQVKVQVRFVGYTPEIKMYGFNSTDVLRGMYREVQVTKTLNDGSTVPARDTYGWHTPLVHYSRTKGINSAYWVGAETQAFEDRWADAKKMEW